MKNKNFKFKKPFTLGPTLISLAYHLLKVSVISKDLFIEYKL